MEAAIETPTSKYADLFAKFDTGDLLMFHGAGYWFSFVVEYMTWSEFSHVGMILKDPTYIDPKLTGYYMLESGTEKFPDAVEHRIHFGVQIVSLEKLFDSYIGRIYHRKLTVSPETRDTFPEILSSVWSTIRDLPYDDRIWDLFRTEFGVNYGNMKRTDTFFCSALQTFLYERFDLFNIPVQWDLITPQNYDDNNKIETLFKEGITFSPKTQIK